MIRIRIIILILIPLSLLSQGAINNNSIDNLTILEIDKDNKLSLSDTSIVYQRKYTDNYKYSDSIMLEELFEVAYPSLMIYNYLKSSKYEVIDSTEDDGVMTYEFQSWCSKDTVDWETDDSGNLIYEIEYDNCRLVDIVKLDEQQRLLEYSFINQGTKSTESYEYDDKGRLYKVDATKAKLTIYYDESTNRIDKIIEVQDNLGNLIETMGSSLEREIEYKFEYNYTN
ncbi:MAG: hypothetical protein ACE364_01590 [Chlorobiota bacterium]